MAAFLLRRFVYTVLLVIISTSVAYLLAATQLNPRSRYEGRNPPPPAEVVDAALDALNMNDKTPLRGSLRPLGRRRGPRRSRPDHRQQAGQRRDRPPHVGQPAAGAARSRSSARCSAWPPARTARSSSIVRSDHVARRCSRSSPSRSRSWCSPSCSRTPASGSTTCSASPATPSCSTRPARSLRGWSPGPGQGSSTGCPSGAAVARAHRHRRRVLRPLSAQRHARRARQRLPAHRAGQGAAAHARAHQARPAHRAHPDGDVLRLPVRAALRRRHVHRENLRLARHGRVLRRLGDQERRELGRRRHAVRRRARAHRRIPFRSSPTRRSIRGCACNVDAHVAGTAETTTGAIVQPPAVIEPTSIDEAASRWTLVRRRLFRQRLAVVGLVVVLLLFALAYLSPLLRHVAVQRARHERVPLAARRPSTGSAPPRTASTCSR